MTTTRPSTSKTLARPGLLSGSSTNDRRPSMTASSGIFAPRAAATAASAARRLVDAGDRRFDLRQLIKRPDPMRVEVIGRDIGDVRDVIVIGAVRGQQAAATRRFQDAHGDPWLRQRHPRTTES